MSCALSLRLRNVFEKMTCMQCMSTVKLYSRYLILSVIKDSILIPCHSDIQRPGFSSHLLHSSHINIQQSYPSACSNYRRRSRRLLLVCWLINIIVNRSKDYNIYTMILHLLNTFLLLHCANAFSTNANEMVSQDDICSNGSQIANPNLPFAFSVPMILSSDADAARIFLRNYHSYARQRQDRHSFSS